MGLQSGQILSHYRLLEIIGEGGMGVVWRAVDQTLDREVAIKVLPEELSRDKVRLARFEREARLLASLNHPNVATVHGLERSGDVLFLVMELVVGRTVADRLRDGPWDLEDALPLLRQMALGLEAAHEKGIIHRDLKPSNIHVSDDGRVKILDFGLAKTVHDPVRSDLPENAPTLATHQTKSGIIVGTMNYMSPEQIEGRPLDRRSDLFQLGMVFAEMLQGDHPFPGLTPVDVQHAILRQPARLEGLRSSTIPEFVRIVEKLLEKDREYRFPTAAALGVDLRALIRDSDSQWMARSVEGAARRGWFARRWPMALAIALLVAAAVVVGTISGWDRGSSPPATSPVPSRLVPLAQSEGDNAQPAFSPDGASLVFSSNRSGSWDLWVALVAGGRPIRITETPETDAYPAWSPAGDRVAFTRYGEVDGRPDLWIVPALGGVARRVCEDGYDADWAPDGGRLVFVRDGLGWASLFEIDVDRPGEPRPITRVEDGVFHRHPTWTPDGTWILFTRSQGGSSGTLMRIRASGGEPEPLGQDPEDVSSFQPDATPDGAYVVHASDRGGTINLWRLPFSGGEAERITFGPGPDSAPAVSPDGHRVAFVNIRADPRVILVGGDGSEQEIIASLDGGLAWGPVFSPDASLIALSRKPPGQPWRIQTMGRSGGSLTTVIEAPFSVLWPRFHPDGDRILFFTWPGRQRIGMVDLDGGDLTWLTDESDEAAYPAVSPDGTTLAFVRGAGEQESTDIVLRALDGGEERVVMEGATLPEFSPDGRHLAFSGGRTSSGRVGVLDLETGEHRWLTEGGTWPAWMPDGRSIAYAAASDEGSQMVRIVTLDGARDEVLGDYSWNGFGFPFAVDERTGGILTTDSTGERRSIWLAEYDLP